MAWGPTSSCSPTHVFYLRTWYWRVYKFWTLNTWTSAFDWRMLVFMTFPSNGVRFVFNMFLICYNNNNLPLIMVKTNCSTLHTVYDIQLSATQGSNDTTHRLSRRTATTTRFSPEGIGCQKQTAPRFCQQSNQMGLYFAAFTRWHHQSEVELIW